MNPPQIDGRKLPDPAQYSLDRVAVLGSKAILGAVAIALLAATSL